MNTGRRPRYCECAIRYRARDLIDPACTWHDLGPEAFINGAHVCDGQPMILDLLLGALADRPARLCWQRPLVLLPVLQAAATGLRADGYVVSTGRVGDDGAFLVGRRPPEVTG